MTTRTKKLINNIAEFKCPDIIVVGTGRSGTSFVAAVLHEDFDVCMAHKFNVANKTTYRTNTYEEGQNGLYKHTGQLVVIPTADKIRAWLKAYTKIHKQCDGLIGLKHWRLAFCIPTVWEILAPKLVIRTHRNPIDTARSMIKKRDLDEQAWIEFCDQAEWSLNRSMTYLMQHNISEVVNIDMNFEWTREKMRSVLGPWVEVVRNGP